MPVTTKLDLIRRRYSRLAAIYPVFNLIFALSSRMRASAVDRLALKTGATVLEVGCGTGSNFGLLEKAVGPAGEVLAVDFSDAMIARARARCRKHGWNNITLLAQDAAEMVLPSQVDAALFSVSYSVMPDPQKALRQAWKYLRNSGSLVILDARLGDGMMARLARPLVKALSDATVLGDLDRRPWDDLKHFTSHVEVEQLKFGYYICRGVKLVADSV